MVVPEKIPLTMPLSEPIEAVIGALLVQTPPAIQSVNVTVEPTQTAGITGKGHGAVVTVTVSVV